MSPREKCGLDRQRIDAGQARMAEPPQTEPSAPEALQKDSHKERGAEGGIAFVGRLFSNAPPWAKVAAVVLGALLVITVLYRISRSPSTPQGSGAEQKGGSAELPTSPPTWQTQSTGTQQWLSSVAFVSPQAGWAVGEGGTILHTADGGQSWQAQSSGTKQWLGSVGFVSPQAGWAVGDGGTILHTADGGQSWQQQSSGTHAWLYSVAFVSPQAG